MPEKSRLRRSISRWANPDRQHARDLRSVHHGHDVVRISEAPERAPVTLRGSVRSLVVRPRGGVPALEAEVYDGTGSVFVVWLGRRRIAGIEAGRSLEVHGRIGVQDGERIMYNPRYELMA